MLRIPLLPQRDNGMVLTLCSATMDPISTAKYRRTAAGSTSKLVVNLVLTNC